MRLDNDSSSTKMSEAELLSQVPLLVSDPATPLLTDSYLRGMQPPRPRSHGSDFHRAESAYSRTPASRDPLFRRQPVSTRDLMRLPHPGRPSASSNTSMRSPESSFMCIRMSPPRSARRRKTRSFPSMSRSGAETERSWILSVFAKGQRSSYGSARP